MGLRLEGNGIITVSWRVNKFMVHYSLQLWLYLKYFYTLLAHTHTILLTCNICSYSNCYHTDITIIVVIWLPKSWLEDSGIGGVGGISVGIGGSRSSDLISFVHCIFDAVYSQIIPHWHKVKRHFIQFLKHTRVPHYLMW